jgi:hypothetical protein
MKSGSFVRKAAIPVVLLAALALPCVAAKAKSPSAKGTVSGIVTRPNGVYAKAATVTLSNLESGETRQAIVGTHGKFKFKALPTGSYELRVAYEGYEEFVSEEITLAGNKSIHLAITLTQLDSDEPTTQP